MLRGPKQGAFFGGGFAGEREGALRALEIGLRILEGEFRNARAEHGLESVLGPLEEFVGLTIALLGVLQMVSQGCKLVREFFHLLFHPGEAFQQAPGIFFHLHAAKAHGDHTKMSVEGIRRNGDDLFIAAIGVERLALVVLRLKQFVIYGFRGDEHQSDVQGAFIGDDVFFADGVGVAFNRDGESAPRFLALGTDSAISVERKFGINGHEFFVAKHDHGVSDFAA